MTANDLVQALAARHPADKAVFVSECKMGESWGSTSRRLDAWALLKSWSPMTAIGYEVKVSRSDFLGDRKWERYLPVCHEFYFVCPKGLIQAEELPEGVGLLWAVGEGSRLLTKRKAVRHDVDARALTSLMAYVLMSRSRVVADMHEAARTGDARDRWAAWLAEDDGKRWLGHMVGRRLAERLARAERERDAALVRVARLDDVRARVREWGLDPDRCSRYDLERRFGGGREVLRRLARDLRLQADEAERHADDAERHDDDTGRTS